MPTVPSALNNREWCTVSDRTRWEPLPDLPESPAAEIETYSGADAALDVVVCYSLIVRNPPRDLLLRFDQVRAWQVAEDGSPVFESMWPEQPSPQSPMVSGTEWAGCTWPLQILKGTRWREMIANRIYSHQDVDRLSCYFIVTLNECLMVATERSVDARWIPGASTREGRRGKSVTNYFTTACEP